MAEITRKPEAFRKFRARSFKVSSMVPVVDIVEHLWCGALDHPEVSEWFFRQKLHPASLRIEALLLKPCLEGTDSGWGKDL